MTTLEVKPCPFCGGNAEQDCDPPYSPISAAKLGKSCAIYCTTCSASMSERREDYPHMTPDELRALLAEAWNRRADLRDEVIKGLMEAAQDMRRAFIPFSDDEFRAVYAVDAALAAAKAVQHE